MNENNSINNNQSKTVFSTGAVRDTNSSKEDYIESISWLTLRRFAQYMSSKAAVYGRGNWAKGIPIDSYEQSLLRHIQKYLANKYYDAGLEPEEDHLAAALFNLQGIIHEEEKLKIQLKKEAKDVLDSKAVEPVPIAPSKGPLTSILETIANENAEILKLREDGLTVEEIADKTGLSSRTIYRRFRHWKSTQQK